MPTRSRWPPAWSRAATIASCGACLERGDIAGGRDGAGRILIQLAVDRATFERLMAFGADLAETEDNGDAEPDWLEAA